MVYFKYFLILVLFIISCSIGKYNCQASRPNEKNIGKLRFLLRSEDSNELEDNDFSSEELESGETYPLWQFDMSKRALPRMGRRYLFDDVQENDFRFGEMPEYYEKRALPRMGRALPRMGRALPRMGRALPRMGRALPRMGRALPRMG